MNLLSVLAAGPSAFRGTGVNHEDETFIGELKVQVLEAGFAVLLHYTATLSTGVVVHSESTLLGTGSNGRLCLWPVMSELPAVIPHPEVMASGEPGEVMVAVFGSGPNTDAMTFREEITIRVDSEGSLLYAHAWGLPGGPFEQRSSCSMAPSAA